MGKYMIFAHAGHEHTADSGNSELLMWALGIGLLLILGALILFVLYAHRKAIKTKLTKIVRSLITNQNKLIYLVYKLVLPAVILAGLGLLLLTVLLVYDGNIAVLNPKGSIAQEQFNLIVFTVLLSLIIVIPVFTLTFYIAWKYRAGNKKAKYSPERDGSRILETIWWLIPLVLILILSVTIWKSSHQLDPFKSLTSNREPITIQVVALEWKWLFLYPKQDIATVNYIQFPEDTPVNFEITADAPMNSFWIPQLGGQIYAMAGMQTKLHLMANETGDYNGSSANLSGEGFSGMKFVARASTPADFDRWVQAVKRSPEVLDMDTYKTLAKPSKDNPITYYSSSNNDLYNTVIGTYMTPGGHDQGTSNLQQGSRHNHD